MAYVAYFDTVKTLAFGGISGSYADVGSAMTARGRLFCFSNDTDANVYFSSDGTNDHIWVKAGGYKMIDGTANMNSDDDDDYKFPIGLQWEVKAEASSPTSGSVYIESLL